MAGRSVGAAILYDSSELFTAQRISSDPPYVNEIDLTTSKPGGFSNPWTTGYNYPGGNPPPFSLLLPRNMLCGSFAAKRKAHHARPVELKAISARSETIGCFQPAIWPTKPVICGSVKKLNPAIYSPAVCAEFAKGCSTSNTNQRKLLEQLNRRLVNITATWIRLAPPRTPATPAPRQVSVVFLPSDARHIRHHHEHLRFHCVSEGDFSEPQPERNL